jgi:hypothetical protein
MAEFILEFSCSRLALFFSFFADDGENETSFSCDKAMGFPADVLFFVVEGDRTGAAGTAADVLLFVIEGERTGEAGTAADVLLFVIEGERTGAAGTVSMSRSFDVGRAFGIFFFLPRFLLCFLSIFFGELAATLDQRGGKCVSRNCFVLGMGEGLADGFW